MARPVRSVATTLLAGLLTAVLPGTPAGASGDVDPRGDRIVSRSVVFEVQNVNNTAVACRPDSGSYRLRGRLVGPRSEVLGSGADRINALVHDTSTGGWFWNLRRHPRYDYATGLAARGETSLVLDRLGYDRSPLADGHATCLGAQADMLHQVVQKLRSGNYRFTHDERNTTPAAHHVVVHAHSLGASVAQVEAATYDDVAGLVLMSWADSAPSQLALESASRQSVTCLRGDEYAPFAPSGRAFRAGVFVTAPEAVRHSASRLRNLDPCGDVLSYASTQLTSRLSAGELEAPVLLLFGGRDALTGDGAPQQQAQSYRSSTSVTLHVTERAGNALPLERSAPATRRRVGEWLNATLG